MITAASGVIWNCFFVIRDPGLVNIAGAPAAINRDLEALGLLFRGIGIVDSAAGTEFIARLGKFFPGICRI